MSVKSIFQFFLVNTALISVLLLCAALLSNAASANPQVTATPSAKINNTLIQLDVHKSPTCGCCGKWVDHLNQHGMNVISHKQENMSSIKDKHGIKRQYRSCHTAVSKNGFIFEGHVPAKFIKQFLKEQPTNAIGLSVPGMPVGSPGMEVADKFMPYQVLQLMMDGSSKIYASVKTIEEQF